jgi:hypothetical protein
MAGWTPKAWMRPLPEWDPESLPGFAEARAKVERGEPLFPRRVAGPAPRRRSVEELIAERDRLAVRRAALGVVSADPAAARLSVGAAHRQADRLDRDLVKWRRLDARISALTFRIEGLQS